MKEPIENSKKRRSTYRLHGTTVVWMRMAAALAVSIILTSCQSSLPKHSEQAGVAGSDGNPSYAADIAPLLKQKCSACHGFLIAEKGLRLNSLANLLKGGESGPAVVPGSPQMSPLYTALSLPADHVGHMPPLAAGPGLDDAQKALIGAWIQTGAR